MPRKTLLTFLGNSHYQKCRYENQDRRFRSPVVRFVQEAVVEMHCRDWCADDRILVFLTDEAEKNNWLGAIYPGEEEGLKNRLWQMKLKAAIEEITGVPKGFSEAEIWQIFELFFNKMEEGDEVYFDITHGFRSLPMLGMVLMNYAKALKGIKVKAITYGAFDALGSRFNIEERIPDPEQRIVPLLDLTGFHELQEWSIAADNFVKSGNTAKMIALTEGKTAPMVHSAKETSPPLEALKLLSKNLNQLSGIMATNRGNEIMAGKTFDHIAENLAAISKNPKVIPALQPILDKLQQKLKNFNQQMPNWISAVQWCIDHDLIQQGITQLQEGLLTHFCNIDNNGFIELDPANETHRTLMSQAILIGQKGIDLKDWYDPAAQNVEIINMVLKNETIQQLLAPYESLTWLRNDINHGGFLSEKPLESFRLELVEKFNEIKVILAIK
ncbi:MAG: TIGR02221 family CRISPR-associated protein [Saprospiraceae bacterium]|nr:TIGR02221 family CRISPR-associated protein [Saprospiraceae bacterium]MCB9323928.1 TIGR02221 family CRISPR-associated protein [Lewinellaceae bacterium]